MFAQKAGAGQEAGCSGPCAVLGRPSGLSRGLYGTACRGNAGVASPQPRRGAHEWPEPLLPTPQAARACAESEEQGGAAAVLARMEEVKGQLEDVARDGAQCAWEQLEELQALLKGQAEAACGTFATLFDAVRLLLRAAGSAVLQGGVCKRV